MSKPLISREQARAQGLNRYYDGHRCKYDHDSDRYTRGGSCVECYRREPERVAYRNMLTRCYNKNAANYHNYGGRGVTVCPGWLGPDGYANFLMDMGRRPEGTSLERFDNDLLLYSPDNCLWATQHHQNRNKRTTVKVELDGRRICLADAARTLGIVENTIRSYITRHGVTPQQALDHYRVNGAMPTGVRNCHRLSVGGEIMSLTAAAKHLRMNRQTIRDKAVYRYDGDLQKAVDYFVNRPMKEAAD